MANWLKWCLDNAVFKSMLKGTRHNRSMQTYFILKNIRKFTSSLFTCGTPWLNVPAKMVIFGIGCTYLLYVYSVYEFLMIFTLLFNKLCVLLTIIFTIWMHVLYFFLYTFILYPYTIANAKPLVKILVRIVWVYSIDLYNKYVTVGRTSWEWTFFPTWDSLSQWGIKFLFTETCGKCQDNNPPNKKINTIKFNQYMPL